MATREAMPSLPDLCESAFLFLYQSAPPAALAGYGTVRQKDYDPDQDRPLPFLLFNAGVKEAKRRPQPGVYDVFLHIYVSTNAVEDPDGTAHEAAVVAVRDHINSKAAVKAAVNATPGFLMYDYFLESQVTQVIQTGEWETEIVLKVVCQAR